ncbi:MAG: gamma-glutamyltransferase, partial [Propionibacteriaceae bacterium]
SLAGLSPAFRGAPTRAPSPPRALVGALRAPDRRAETTNVVAVDAQGDACVATTSLGLGSGVWVPGYGVHLNSMLGEGELVRAALRPGERMGSMMSPLVGLGPDGSLLVAAGAAGGSRIRPALVQVLLRVLAGQAPQAAIEAPRLNALPGMVRCEPGFSPAVLAALAADGEEIAVAPGPAPYFGGVTAVSRRGSGADPRRGGAAVTL